MSIPKLRFSEFSDKWKSNKLSKVAKVTSGGTPNRSEEKYWNGTIPWVSTSLINFNTIFSSEEYITKKGLENSSAKLFPIGTILLAMYGQGKTRGKVAILGIEASTNQACSAIIPNDTIHNNYLFQNFIGRYDEIRRLSNEGGQQNLSGSIIKDIPIRFPNLPEQQKIASFLTDVDAKISQLTKKKALLEQYKKGVMQKLFNQELRFKDDHGNAFPDWEEKKLGEVSVIKSSKRVLQEDWKDIGVPFYRTREIISLSENKEFRTPIFITEKMYDELIEKYGVPKENDILVTGVGTIGKTYIVKKDDRFYFKDGNVLWIKISNKINSEFLHQQFNTRFIRKQLSDNASITTVATFTIDGARNTMIKLPCIEEQTKIANFLSDIDVKLEALNAKIEQNKVFKKGLLQQMFV